MRTLLFFISTLLLLGVHVNAQDSNGAPVAVDSSAYKQVYGLRLGIDLSRPVRTAFDKDYTGFELVGDMRVTHRLSLAAELGTEKRDRAEVLGNSSNPNQFEIYDYQTSGSYLKLGVDVNTYNNWYGMNNTIFFGGRYAFSTMTQTLNNYTVFDSNRYWSPDGFVPGAGGNEEFTGQNASWLELVTGLKAELFANIFIGVSVRLNFLVTNTQSDRLPNLWIPGFNKVTQDSKFGVGFNYSISYLIPLYKKNQKNKAETPGE